MNSIAAVSIAASAGTARTLPLALPQSGPVQTIASVDLDRYLGDRFSWAVVGSPDREYLWILARAPTMDEERYTSALVAARANGFNLDRLTKRRQMAYGR
jgi:lipocalin